MDVSTIHSTGKSMATAITTSSTTSTTRRALPPRRRGDEASSVTGAGTASSMEMAISPP